jgi:alkylation response protein AidB-like acyl-CoA dehydrogenase
VDYSFSVEQEMLRDAAREWLSDRYDAVRVAELADSEAGWDPASWAELGRLGWLDDDLGVLELAVLAEETGYALYPGPWWSTVALAAPVWGTTPTEPTTLAWADAEAHTLAGAARGVAVRAEDTGDGWRLYGEKERVPDLAAASTVLVVAHAGDGTGLFAVTPGRGAIVTPVSTMDRTRRYGRLALDGAGADLVVEPGRAGPVLADVRRRALALLACEGVGVLQRALDTAVAYARDRTQFGRPIGSFQAVSHRLADTYRDLQLARSLAYRAAWAVETGDGAIEEAVASAAACVGEVAVTGCERAIQAMGGIGFTWDHVLHRLYKRAQWIASVEGPPSARRAELAAMLLDT